MTDDGKGDARGPPAKRARHGEPRSACADGLPWEARLPPELWSRVFAAVDDPVAAAAWRAASAGARRLFDALPGHDPSCGGNRALYEACRRVDEAAVCRLLADRRVVASLCHGAPNRHGSLFGHESASIACRLLAASADAADAHGPRLATRDVEAACMAARTTDAVPLLLLAAAPARAHPARPVPVVASAVGVTEACLDAAIAHRRPLLVRALLAFAASHASGTRDYGDLPARAAVSAARRRDADMLRIVLDADGYRAPEAALARNHGDAADGEVDPLCEAVRYGWAEGVRLVAAHRCYAVPGPYEPPLDRVQRLARAWCVALAYWMAVRLRRAEAVRTLTRSHRPTWCHPESPHAIEALLAHGPTRTFVALIKTAPMARKVAQHAAATGRAVALGVALARVQHLCAGTAQGVLARAVAKAVAAARPHATQTSSGVGLLSRRLTDASPADVDALVRSLLHDPPGPTDPWAPVPVADDTMGDNRGTVGDGWACVKRSGYLDGLCD